jgi:hypothetical protein
MTVAGIPNFFMLYGPNTNGGASIIATLERQAEVVARSARRMKRTGARVVETRRWAMERYVRWIDERNTSDRTAEYSGCHNYFFSARGRNVTQLPLAGFGYWLLSKALPPLGLMHRRVAAPVPAPVDEPVLVGRT